MIIVYQFKIPIVVGRSEDRCRCGASRPSVCICSEAANDLAPCLVEPVECTARMLADNKTWRFALKTGDTVEVPSSNIVSIFHRGE